MLTSKERAELRSQANTLETTLMVGKGGVTEGVIAEAENLLTARELVKGKVLEGALMSPREVSDEICAATGADGVAVIGTKFVIYRFSEKCQEERNQTGRAKRKPVPKSKSNPVGKSLRAKRAAAKAQREQRNAYFREKAIEKAIERSRESSSGVRTKPSADQAETYAAIRRIGGVLWKGSAFTAALSIRLISAIWKRPAAPFGH